MFLGQFLQIRWLCCYLVWVNPEPGITWPSRYFCNRMWGKNYFGTRGRMWGKNLCQFCQRGPSLVQQGRLGTTYENNSGVLQILLACWSSLYLYPRCMLILVACWSPLHLDLLYILILVAYWSSLHVHHRCILIHVACWSSLHLELFLIPVASMLHVDPRCMVILVAWWSALHVDPHCIFILVVCWSFLHLYPHCMLILVACWSTLHLHSASICCVLIYIGWIGCLILLRLLNWEHLQSCCADPWWHMMM